jgi:hypothetical protein
MTMVCGRPSCGPAMVKPLASVRAGAYPSDVHRDRARAEREEGRHPFDSQQGGS